MIFVLIRCSVKSCFYLSIIAGLSYLSFRQLEKKCNFKKVHLLGLDELTVSLAWPIRVKAYPCPAKHPYYQVYSYNRVRVSVIVEKKITLTFSESTQHSEIELLEGSFSSSPAKK